ncbi:MAG: TIGR02266 family protein [Myxococcota bacterium]
MADARKDKRTLLSLKIRYKSATLEDFIERYSGDISQGGVFIKAKKPLDVGTLLKFEFLLQDQSSLIHGVGRVVWRREPGEATADSPAGMGIKFIKMDPESRSLVQRICEGRDTPGVFEDGSQPPASEPSLAPVATPAPDDRTKVRHVSEFLASAFEEGAAAAETVSEARAGAQRARQQSQNIGSRRSSPARGVLGGTHEVPTAKRAAPPEASSRSAMSAFGNGGSVSQAVAEPMEEFNAEDDFLDDEQTRIHDYPDPDATVVGGSAAAFMPGPPRQTPVVEAPTPSRLETEIPDLFGPDIASSFSPSGGLEPAPGEILDSSLLDPAVPTVPPPAGVPTGPGIPVEAFKAPTQRAQAAENPYAAGDASVAAARPVQSSGGAGTSGLKKAMPWVLALLVIAGGAFAGWRFGAVDNLKELAAPYIGDEIEVIEETRVEPAADETADVVEEPEAELGASDAGAEATAEAEAPAAPAGPAKLVIESRPARAFVSVDGKPAGRAPITLTLEPGTEVTLLGRAKGYLNRTQKVTVEPGGGTVTLALPTLPYFVEVSSDPPGARVTSVGGGEITTPGDMRFKSMLSPRSIVIAKDGYQTVTKTVSRREFREEAKRMVTSIRVTLTPAASAPSAEAAAIDVAPTAADAPDAPAEEAPESEPTAEDATETDDPAGF